MHLFKIDDIATWRHHIPLRRSRSICYNLTLADTNSPGPILNPDIVILVIQEQLFVTFTWCCFRISVLPSFSRNLSNYKYRIHTLNITASRHSYCKLQLLKAAVEQTAITTAVIMRVKLSSAGNQPQTTHLHDR